MAVAQGRTYIRCDDQDPGHLDVDAAVSNFLRGKVMVSYGLLAEIKINNRFGSGDLVEVGDGLVKVDVRVLGPQWVHANRVLLFANGKLYKESAISSKFFDDLPVGVKWKGGWLIPRPRHDVHLVAIALGPGLHNSSWRTATPYQPMSPSDATHVIGCSGAVWLDADGDGQRTCARDYAERLMARDPGDVSRLVTSLADYDEATAAHVAHLLRISGVSLQNEQLQSILETASPDVQAGFQQYIDAWRENEIARATR